MGRRLGAALLANNALTPALPQRAQTRQAVGVVNVYEKGNYRTQNNERIFGAKHRLDFGLPETRMRLMALCTFCGRAPAVNFALTRPQRRTKSRCLLATRGAAYLPALP